MTFQANANPGVQYAQNDASTTAKRTAKPTSAAPLVRVSPQGGLRLPKTATDAELRMTLGFALLVLSLIAFLLTRRRRFAH